MISLKKIFEKIKKFYHLKILKRRYYRHGKCAMCGCCCENIYVRHEGKVIQSENEFEIVATGNDFEYVLASNSS